MVSCFTSFIAYVRALLFLRVFHGVAETALLGHAEDILQEAGPTLLLLQVFHRVTEEVLLGHAGDILQEAGSVAFGVAHLA